MISYGDWTYPKARRLLVEMARRPPMDNMSPDEAYDYVLNVVEYRRDPEFLDEFVEPEITLERGYGDCEDLSLLLGALAGGAAFTLRIYRDHLGSPVHVAPVLDGVVYDASFRLSPGQEVTEYTPMEDLFIRSGQPIVLGEGLEWGWSSITGAVKAVGGAVAGAAKAVGGVVETVASETWDVVDDPLKATWDVVDDPLKKIGDVGGDILGSSVFQGVMAVGSAIPGVNFVAGPLLAASLAYDQYAEIGSALKGAYEGIQSAVDWIGDDEPGVADTPAQKAERIIDDYGRARWESLVRSDLDAALALARSEAQKSGGGLAVLKELNARIAAIPRSARAYTGAAPIIVDEVLAQEGLRDEMERKIRMEMAVAQAEARRDEQATEQVVEGSDNTKYYLIGGAVLLGVLLLGSKGRM